MEKKQFIIAVVCGLVIGFSISAYAQTEAEPTERFAKIEELSGEVKLKTGIEDSWKEAEVGMQITQDCEIKTGRDSRAVLVLDEKGTTGTVDVLPNSWMRLGELGYSDLSKEKRTLLDLALGRILVHAEKLKGNESFQVRTPTSTTSVRGTVFEVSVEDKDLQMGL